MNKVRRTKIKEQIKMIYTVGYNIDTIINEEYDALFGMPESIQLYSQRGKTSQKAIDSMGRVLSLLDDALEELNSLIYWQNYYFGLLLIKREVI